MYNMLLGERSNGKSYATKYVALWEAYHEKDIRTKQPKERCQLAYLRRWRDEIKSRDVEAYFQICLLWKLLTVCLKVYGCTEGIFI